MVEVMARTSHKMQEDYEVLRAHDGVDNAAINVLSSFDPSHRRHRATAPETSSKKDVELRTMEQHPLVSLSHRPPASPQRCIATTLYGEGTDHRLAAQSQHRLDWLLNKRFDDNDTVPPRTVTNFTLDVDIGLTFMRYYCQVGAYVSQHNA